jgi:hypothetical protein
VTCEAVGCTPPPGRRHSSRWSSIRELGATISTAAAVPIGQTDLREGVATVVGDLGRGVPVFDENGNRSRPTTVSRDVLGDQELCLRLPSCLVKMNLPSGFSLNVQDLDAVRAVLVLQAHARDETPSRAPVTAMVVIVGAAQLAVGYRSPARPAPEDAWPR